MPFHEFDVAAEGEIVHDCRVGIQEGLGLFANWRDAPDVERSTIRGSHLTPTQLDCVNWTDFALLLEPDFDFDLALISIAFCAAIRFRFALA